MKTNTPGRISLALGVLAAGLLVYFFAYDQGAGVPLAPAEFAEKEGVRGPDVQAESTPPGVAAGDSDQTSPSPGPANRKPAATSAYYGVMVDDAGQPVPGARLSWTSYPATLLEETARQDLGHWMIDQGQFEKRTVWATANEEGFFSFPKAPESAETDPSVIWATHRDHEATAILLEPGAASWTPGGRTSILPAPGILVRVLDGAGNRAAPAMVYQYALVPASPAVLVALELEDLVRLYLRRFFEVGPNGEVHTPPFPGKVVFEAKRPDEVSMEWKGAWQAIVELQLAPSFLVGGKLVLSEGLEPASRELEILIDAWNGRSSRRIKRVSFNKETLTWGPVPIPMGNEDRYSFQLRALSIQPRMRFTARPAPGESVVIDFESKGGSEVWFALEDQDRNPVSEGLVEVFWNDSAKYGSVQLKVRSDGYVRWLACPEGQVSTAIGSSPGFSTGKTAGFSVPEESPLLHVIALPRAGKIVGRCTNEGLPVAEFSVVFWPTEDRMLRARREFRGAQDGQFVIDDAPLGEIQILAASYPYAPSNSQQLHVSSDEENAVELQLQTSHTLLGNVVDETGAPLVSATLQLYFENDRAMILAWGYPGSVDEMGRFELEGLPLGPLGFQVSAPGYETRREWAPVRPGGNQEPRTIRLQRLRDLEVRIRLPDGIVPETCSISVGFEPAERTPFRPFSTSGVALFSELSPKTDSAWLYLAGKEMLVIGLPKPTGRDWVVEYEIGGTGRVVLDIDPGSMKGETPRTAVIRLESYTHGEEMMGRARTYSETEEVIFDDLRPGLYLAKVSVGGINASASTLFVVTQGETTHVTLHLGAADSVFRVVDEQGRPISGVSLSIYDTTYPLWRRAVTDSKGLCKIPGAPEMDAFAGLQHPDIGNVWGLPVRLARGADEVIELEFVADGEIALRVVDGEIPIAGVACRLSASDNRNVNLYSTFETDAGGKVRFERLGRASYGVDLTSPGIWEKRISVEASDGAETTVQVRRVGNLRFEVATIAGSAVPDLPIEVVFSESGTSAESWIDEGKLRTIPISTRTDASGALLFPAIPHGEYRWRLIAPNGDVMEGTADVPIHGECSVKVTTE